MVAVALGSNLGPSETTLRHAVAHLKRHLRDLRIAPLYRTAALPDPRQPPFLNTVLVGHSRLAPEALLALGKALELAVGRRPGPRDAPRPLDVDLLLWGSRVADAPELTLPHPRLRQRRFYLAPLADLEPTLPVPPDGATVAHLLATLGTTQPIQRIPWTAPPPG